jgi:hypothetical protein
LLAHDGQVYFLKELLSYWVNGNGHLELLEYWEVLNNDLVGLLNDLLLLVNNQKHFIVFVLFVSKDIILGSNSLVDLHKLIHHVEVGQVLSYLSTNLLFLLLGLFNAIECLLDGK